MPRRHDTLSPPPDSVKLRIEMSEETRDQLRVVAAQHKYSMASLLRLLVEAAVGKPEKYFKEIPKNQGGKA